MLIRFNVKNFLSFSEREDGRSEEFSMIAGKVRNKKAHVYDNDKIKLLKFAAIYGANAAGKSNLVKAMDFMKQVVLFGLPKGHTDKYCKIDEANKEKESYFELEIKLGEKYYAYGYEVILSQSKFVSEWLIELTSDNNEKVIFSRDIKNGTFEFGNELKEKGLIDKLEVYAEDIQEDDSILLLSMMNKNKRTLYQQYERAGILRDIYLWIDKSLDINYPNRPISDYSYMAETENVEEVCRIISAFGTGITGFKMVDVAPDKVLGNLPKKIRDELISDIEAKTVELKNNEKMESFGLVMRSAKDFFVLNVNKEGKADRKSVV